jgi:hypothetical protein
MRRTAPKRRYRNTGPNHIVLNIVFVRALGHCEFPGCIQRAQDPHHRFERGMGGVGSKGPAWVNDVCNILAACRHHNDWVSNQQPHEAWEMGWRLKPGELPWEAPVVMDGGSYLLDNDGGKVLWP